MENLSQNPWLEAAAQEAWDRAKKQIDASQYHTGYTKYKDDPVGFVEDLIGDHFTDDVKLIAESVRDNPVTIAKSATDIGKSHCAARIAIWFFSCFPDSKVFITAAPPLENLKQIMWGELSSVIKTKPTLFAGCKVRSLLVSRGPKSFIQGLAIPTSGTPEEREAKFSGKHSKNMLFIVDEGDAVPDEIYKGIEGCMSGGDLIRLLIMFNPRAQSGAVYEKEKMNMANVVTLSAFRHPNVMTGINIIPGAVSRDTIVRRINTWSRPLALEEQVDAECYEVPKELVGVVAVGLDGRPYPPLDEGYRKITDPAFSYMVLGEYPARSATQLISEAWIDAAFSRWKSYVAKYGEIPPEETRPIMSLDIAEYGTDYTCCWLRYGGYTAKPHLWKGIDPDETSERGLVIYKSNNAQIIMVDGTGVGAGVAPSMARKGRKDDLRAVSVKMSEKPSPLIKTDKGEFKILRDQIYWALREWLRTDEGAMLPPDGMLKDELMAMQYQVKNGKVMVTPKEELRKKLKRSPDRADGLALTFSPYERAKWVRVGDRISYDRWANVNKPEPKQPNNDERVYEVTW